MMRVSNPARPGRGNGPADAHGLAVLLVAVILAGGTALPLVGGKGPAFPRPSDARPGARPGGEAGDWLDTGTAGRPAGTTAATSESNLHTLLNINTAGPRALQGLPGIGPALAERIVADREARGPFRAPEDLLRVPGIGPKRWGRIRHAIRVVTEGP